MPSAPQPSKVKIKVEVDVLVVGSGAGGLTAALTAVLTCPPLRVMVIDKAEVLGGTTAWSGGWLWVPGHGHGHGHGHGQGPAPDRAEADRTAARIYLKTALGDAAFERHETLIDAYLHTAPEMLRFFSGPSSAPDLSWQADLATPDFFDIPGAAAPGQGRMVRASALDLRPDQLRHRYLARLRPPLRALTMWGMGIEAGDDLRHFLKATRLRFFFSSGLHALRRLLTFVWQRCWHGQGLHLVNGHALVARLLLVAGAIPEHHLALHTGTRLRQLRRSEGRVTGALLSQGEQTLEVTATQGVVLACGGFAHDLQRLAAWLPHAPTGREHHSAAPTSHTGDGLNAAEAVGAALHTEASAAAAGWCPVSLLPDASAPRGHSVYPHLIDRALPGAMAVLASGQRACNEAGPYPDVVSAWLALAPGHEAPPLWLIADAACVWRYGLGAVKPTGLPSLPLFLNGYATVRWTLAGLARACGIDAAGLAQTVREHNTRLAQGAPPDDGSPPTPWPLDPAFGRGRSTFDRSQGEAGHRPHPNMAPIRCAPYVAIRLWPGSLGTFAGLRTNAQAEVLDSAGQPIPGLWACGNDMASPFAGRYVNSGITLGAAMTFGYRIGRALAACRNASSSAPTQTPPPSTPSPVGPSATLASAAAPTSGA